jgi:hypothetical protein
MRQPEIAPLTLAALENEDDDAENDAERATKDKKDLTARPWF